MEENVAIRSRGGASIVNNPPLFSPDGKYVYTIFKWRIHCYSVQTGECTHQFITDSNEELSFLALHDHRLFSVTPKGNLTIWRLSDNTKEKQLVLDVASGARKNLLDKTDETIVEIHPIKTRVSKWKDYDLILVIKDKSEEEYRHVVCACSNTGKTVSYLFRCLNKPNSISVCDDYVALINEEKLYVFPLTKFGERTSTFAGFERWWTAVAVAPNSSGLAAGDSTGRVVFWPNPYDRYTRSVFHWHTLPVNAITFSTSGSYMYTGAGEGVMVRWSVSVSNVRNFLPRLPAPIQHLAVSLDNQYVAIATADNGIHIADASNRIGCVIQQLTWGVIAVPGSPLFPAGLNWDPRSRSIILNGRPGHLQFFNTDSNKLLYNLDISGQNYLSQERHKIIINTEVTHVAVSQDGKWMVTVETRDDESLLETQLKFWQYKFNARQFSLNTCVQFPHQGKVNRIRFQPLISTTPDHYLLVTTGTDYKFRIWTPSLSESIHSEGLRWVCDSVGCYRALPAEHVAFSADGSILGVNFGHSLTLWDSEEYELNTSLSRNNNTLRALEFGSHECCHLVVTANDFNLYVWSILTLYVVWTVPVCTSVLCTDPLSSYMAIFTKDNFVLVFSPSSPKLVFEKKVPSNSCSKVISAIFVPRPQKLLDTNANWCSNSQLHFIDDNQELQYLELEREQDPELCEVHSLGTTSAVTPFSILAAKQSISEVDTAQTVTHDQLGTARDAAVRKLLKNTAHTMPHINLFCSSFLKSLAITRKTENKIKQGDCEEDAAMDASQDSDSSEELKKSSSNEISCEQLLDKINISEEQLPNVNNDENNIDLAELFDYPQKENPLPSWKKDRRKSKETSFTCEKNDSNHSQNKMDVGEDSDTSSDSNEQVKTFSYEQRNCTSKDENFNPEKNISCDQVSKRVNKPLSLKKKPRKSSTGENSPKKETKIFIPRSR